MLGQILKFLKSLLTLSCEKIIKRSIRNIEDDSVPRCSHFGCHGEWKKFLATKILAKVG